MIRSVLFGAALSVGFAVSASAGDDVMAGYYGNTAIATGGMAETHTVYNADHTFAMKAPAFGVEYDGKWALDGANLCRTFDKAPTGVPNPLCTPVEAHKVGDTWTVTTGGGTRTVTIVKGIQ